MIKAIAAAVLLPVIFLASLRKVRSYDDDFINFGGIVREQQDSEYSQEIKVKEGDNLESVSFTIWQRRLDGIMVFLENPDGVRIEITRANGKYGSWYFNTTISDHADSLIYTAHPNFRGVYRPHQFLGWLNKGKMNGRWKLIVRNKHPFARTGALLYWELKFSKNNKNLESIPSSTLPILVIETSNQKQISETKKTKAQLYILSGNHINYVSDTSTSDPVKVKLRVRGFSSSNLPKKSYSVDIVDGLDSSLFENMHLPPGTEWVLSANCMEKSMIRNSFTYELYNQAGHDASKGTPVEVVLNGAYIGIYILQQKIQPSPSMLKDTWADTSGFMVKIDSYYDFKEGFFSAYHGRESNHKIYFQFAYPHPKTLTSNDAMRISNTIHLFEKKLMSSTSVDALDFIDVQSFADYFLFQEFTKNNDGLNLSANLYLDKQHRIAIGPVWDFDRSLGNSTSGFTRKTEGWRIDIHHSKEYHPIPQWWEILRNNAQFQQLLKERWNVLGKTVLSETNMMIVIDSLAAPIRREQEKNFKVWPIWGIKRSNFYTDPFIRNYDDEINDLKKWVIKRREWMDGELKKMSVTASNPA